MDLVLRKVWGRGMFGSRNLWTRTLPASPLPSLDTLSPQVEFPQNCLASDLVGGMTEAGARLERSPGVDDT